MTRSGACPFLGLSKSLSDAKRSFNGTVVTPAKEGTNAESMHHHTVLMLSRPVLTVDSQLAASLAARSPAGPLRHPGALRPKTTNTYNSCSTLPKVSSSFKSDCITGVRRKALSVAKVSWTPSCVESPTWTKSQKSERCFMISLQPAARARPLSAYSAVQEARSAASNFRPSRSLV